MAKHRKWSTDFEAAQINNTGMLVFVRSVVVLVLKAFYAFIVDGVGESLPAS